MSQPVDVSGEVNEAELLEGLRAGKAEAYETLVRHFGGRLLAVARRYLRNDDDAQDAVQDAFLSAFRSIHSFQGDSRLSTWLHRIVVNASLMKLRTRRRKPEESIDDMLPQFLDDGHMAKPASQWSRSADEMLQSQELRERVRESINRLPENYRTILMLRDIEEMDTQEAAQMLDITENAVKTRLHRARLALREMLDASFREEQA